MYKITSFLFILILLNACTSKGIAHLDKSQTRVLYEKTINIGNIQVEQKVFLLNERSMLVYEDAKPATSYKFNHGVRRTVGIVFDTYNYELLNSVGNVYLFVLSSKDAHDTEYLILENMNKKRIKMIYGVDKSLVEKIFNTFETDKKFIAKDIKTKSQHNIQNEPSFYIKSGWNHKNIIFDTIIQKEGYGRGRI